MLDWWQRRIQSMNCWRGYIYIYIYIFIYTYVWNCWYNYIHINDQCTLQKSCVCARGATCWVSDRAGDSDPPDSICILRETYSVGSGWGTSSAFHTGDSPISHVSHLTRLSHDSHPIHTSCSPPYTHHLPSEFTHISQFTHASPDSDPAHTCCVTRGNRRAAAGGPCHPHWR